MPGQLAKDVHIEIVQQPIVGGFPFAGRVVLYPFVAVCEGASLGCRVELLIDRDPGAPAGRMIVSKFRAELDESGAPITTTVLGRLPLKALVDEALRQAAVPIYDGTAADYVTDDVLALVRPKSRRGTLQIADKELKRVAKTARDAGRSRIAAVADAFKVSRPTAWRAIDRARENGFDVGDD